MLTVVPSHVNARFAVLTFLEICSRIVLVKQPHEMRPGNRYWKPPPAPADTWTLRDLARAKLALVAVCKRCRHRSVLFPYSLAEKLGQHFPVGQLAQRLRCTECDALGWVTLHQSVRD